MREKVREIDVRERVHDRVSEMREEGRDRCEVESA